MSICAACKMMRRRCVRQMMIANERTMTRAHKRRRGAHDVTMRATQEMSMRRYAQNARVCRTRDAMSYTSRRCKRGNNKMRQQDARQVARVRHAAEVRAQNACTNKICLHARACRARGVRPMSQDVRKRYAPTRLMLQRQHATVRKMSQTNYDVEMTPAREAQ